MVTVSCIQIHVDCCRAVGWAEGGLAVLALAAASNSQACAEVLRSHTEFGGPKAVLAARVCCWRREVKEWLKVAPQEV